MATFTVRVQGAGGTTLEVYETHHQAMRAQGFTRTVSSDDGISHNLPTGRTAWKGRSPAPRCW
jgi:hypothetical protein